MKFRKIIILFIVFVLVVFTTSSSYANPFTDIENNPHKSAIIQVAELGILLGIGNNQFAPDLDLNRAAASKVAAYLMGYTEKDAQEAANWDAKFNDVHKGMGSHEWALGWINLMESEGIIVGVGGGNFNPSDPLQMSHWNTIILRILGFEEPNMEWPREYNQLAESLGLLEKLNYISSKIMNRAEMARMTSTAIFNIPNKNGDLIRDLFDFEQHNQIDEPIIYDEANIVITVTNPVVSLGGNQSVEVVVKATYGKDKLPAAGTMIEFFANVDNNDRRSSLSSDRILTNNDGVAKVIFTTSKEDDNKYIMFLANIHTGGNWIDKTTTAIVSNNVSKITGEVINPFNGEVMSSTKVGIDKDGIYTQVSIDEFGNFEIYVTPGKLSINIDIAIGEELPYSGYFRGSHFSIDENKQLRYSLQRDIISGREYKLPTAMGIIAGTTSRYSPQTDVYIVNTSTGETVIATINASNRIMVTLAPGTYEINNRTGTILKRGIIIEKGKINDIGSF